MREGDSGERDNLIEPEGVNAGGPVVGDQPESGRTDRGGRAAVPPPDPAPGGDNGQMLSGAAGPEGGRPPQPGQELAAGEG